MTEAKTSELMTDAQILSATLHPRLGPIILSRFKPEWLGTPEFRQVFESSQEFFTQFREIPTPQSLAEYIKLKGQFNVERIQQFATLISELPPLQNPEFFEFQLEKRLQGKALYKAIKDAVVLMQDERYDDIFGLFHRARVDSLITQKGTGSFWQDWDLRNTQLRGNPTPTGYTPLDNLLRGGLYPGELMLTIGLKSTGKSFFAVWVGRASLFAGKTTVIFTMEMSRGDLLKRVDCSIANFDFDIYQDNKDAVKQMVMDKQNELLGDLYVIEYPSGYPTVQIVENEILEIEQRIGKKVDCFVIDYIDLMRGTVVGSKGDARFGLISTAVELRGLCGRNQLAGVVLTQSNALGKKRVFIEAENAAEAYGQTWSADFVLSINEVVGRPDQRRIYVADSRRTQKKVSFLYEVDFSRAQWTEKTGF